MKKRELVKTYTKAAEDIAELRCTYSCAAVNRRSKQQSLVGWSEETFLYIRTMLPRNDPTFPLSTELPAERQNIRVLLLLFMAEWVKTDYVES